MIGWRLLYLTWQRHDILVIKEAENHRDINLRS